MGNPLPRGEWPEPVSTAAPPGKLSGISLRGTGTFSNAGAVGLDQLSCADRKRQGHAGVAIAQSPQTVGRGHEALRISREFERLSWPHRDLRRVTPPGQHLMLAKHRDRSAALAFVAIAANGCFTPCAMDADNSLAVTLRFM